MKRGQKATLAAAALTLATQAVAGETVTYSYDALGRLVGTSTAGSVNNGLSVSTGYDPAGNRCHYSVAGAGGAPPPPAPPCAPPPGDPPGDPPDDPPGDPPGDPPPGDPPPPPSDGPPVDQEPIALFGSARGSI